MGNLQQLRIKILKHEELLRVKEKLLADREELAEKIEAIQEGLTPSVELDAIKDEIKRLKISLRHLDAQIDELDTLSEETLYRLKQDYILQVLENHPEKKSSYEQALKDEARIHEECKGIEDARDYLIPIQFHLSVIEYARNRIKRLWILSYLIGKSPNYEITHSWLELRKELDKDMPERLTLDLQDKIHSFRKTIKERWGLGVIDREVRLFHILIKKEISHIEKALTQLRGALKKLDDDLLKF